MFHYVALLLWLSIAPLSRGAGLGVSDTLETVGWQSDPNGRGTYTLVSSGLLTLMICIYSAKHLNVPPHGESTLRLWTRNVRWALLGVFGPELVVFIAWKQYLSAKTFVERSKNELGAEKTLSHVEGIQVHCDTVGLLLLPPKAI